MKTKEHVSDRRERFCVLPPKAGNPIQILTAIEENYSSYQWTPEKIASFRLREQAEIDANNDSIQNVLARSFELKFRGASDE